MSVGISTSTPPAGSPGFRRLCPVGGKRTWVALAAAGAVTGVAFLPVALVGALAVQMQTDLGFGATELGMGVAAYFGVSALGSVPMGRWVESVGFGGGALATAALSAAAMLGLGVLAQSWGVALVCLLLAGLANSLAQPTANLVLARTIREGRWGVAFGLKQATLPISTLLAGISVPAIGLSVGWRWAFVAAAAAPLALIALARPNALGAKVRRPPPILGKWAGAAGGAHAGTGGIGGLILLSVGGGFGAAAANCLGAFLVLGLVTRSVAPGVAGLFLACGSLAGIGVRIATGWAIDRHALPGLPVVSLLCATGAVGFLLLGFGRSPAMLLTGTLVGFSFGWGWSGALSYAVVKLNPSTPAAATGIMHAGTYSGGVVGPLFFGLILDHASFTSAWTAGAVSLTVCAVLMLALHVRVSHM